MSSTFALENGLLDLHRELSQRRVQKNRLVDRVPTVPVEFEPPATGPNGKSDLPSSKVTFSNGMPSCSEESE